MIPPKIIIISGHLAAGKSTFTRRLSKTIDVPCFIKDTFMIALCESVSVVSIEESRRFSDAAFMDMFISPGIRP